MSEYVPTANDVKHWLCEPQYAGGLFDDETAAKFDRMIAEVERAAAVKALTDAAEATEEEAPGEPHAGATFVAHAAWLRARAEAYRGEKNE